MKELFDVIVKRQDAILTATLQHINIALLAVLIGAAVAIPSGIWLTRNKKTAGIILGITGVAQTIPSLVLFGLALPVFGLGFKPALVVLSLYSILPVLRNTYIGISEVDDKYIQAARGMGMSGMQRLYMVELPIALPVIIAGIRISLVYIISWTTVAALIGAGGLGDLIWTGLQSYDRNLIIAGAIPASVLALSAGLIIGVIQKKATPKGMRK